MFAIKTSGVKLSYLGDSALGTSTYGLYVDVDPDEAPRHLLSVVVDHETRKMTVVATDTVAPGPTAIPTNGIASYRITTDPDSGVTTKRISGDSVRTYIFPRALRFVATLYGLGR